MTQESPLNVYTPPADELAPVDPRPINIGALLQTIVNNPNMTRESAEVAEKFTKLALQMQEIDAKKKFKIAKAAMQAEIPKIVANKKIPGKTDASPPRSRFASYDHIMDEIQPLLTKYGFSVDFDMDAEPMGEGTKLTAFCTLSHDGGHQETKKFSSIVSTPPGANITQGYGATYTFCQRYALRAQLNITIDVDTDARVLGDTITAEKAAELERRIAGVQGNVAGFLKFAGAESFDKIHESKLIEIEEMLAEKEKFFASRNNPTQQPLKSEPPQQRGPRPLWNDWISSQYAEWELAGQDGKKFTEVVNGFVLAKGKKLREDELTDGDRQALKVKLAEAAARK